MFYCKHCNDVFTFAIGYILAVLFFLKAFFI